MEEAPGAWPRCVFFAAASWMLHTVQLWKGICCYTASLKAVQRAHSKSAAAKD